MQSLTPVTITTAISATATGPVKLNGAPRNLTCQATFAGGTGGTSVDAYLRTSLDGGVTWIEIANFHFTNTPGRVAFNLSAATPVTTQADATATPSSNASVDGILGPIFDVLYSSVGTYTGGTTLRVDIAGIDIPANPS